MTTIARQRIMRDFLKLRKNSPTAEVTGAPTDNMMIWDCVIFGVPDTPYENGIFKLTLTFPENYPSEPPTARFVNHVFHPNVFKSGIICLDILSTHWTPAYDVLLILTSIRLLLNNPNPKSPANGLAAHLYETNLKEYQKHVIACVEQSLTN